MQIYFHSRLCSYLPRVPILVEGTVSIESFKLLLNEINQIENKNSFDEMAESASLFSLFYKSRRFVDIVSAHK